jgi:hypothetical protein
MARKTRQSKARSQATRRRRYTAVELLMASLGGLVLILVVGIIVTAMLQGD